MNDRCICHLNGYAIKDATARAQIEELSEEVSNLPKEVVISESDKDDIARKVLSPELQEKTITANGEYMPDTGFVGIAKVIVDVPEKEVILQEKAVTENGEYTPDEGYDGIGKVVVNVQNEQINPLLQEKTVTENGTYTPDIGYDGLSAVHVNVETETVKPVLEELNVTENGVYAPSPNVDGFKKVTVSIPESNDIVNGIANGTLEKLVLNSPNKIRSYAFVRWSTLQEVVINGDSIDGIFYEAFFNCTGLKRLSACTVKRIGARAFYGCTAMEQYDFTRMTAIPTLDDATAFNGIPENCKIVVPDNLYDAWIVASNWVYLASHIIKASDINVNPETCEHEWEYTIVDEYFHNKTCKICGMTVTNEEHNTDGAYSYVTETTCGQMGVYHKTCTCGHVGSRFFEEPPTEDHNFVDGVCTVCGATETPPEPEIDPETCEHDWYFMYVNSTNHKKICNICGTEITENHTITYEDIGNGNHWIVCSDCGMKNTYESHVFVDGVCVKCGATDPDYTEPTPETCQHNNATENFDNNVPKTVCSDCGEVLCEHTFGDYINEGNGIVYRLCTKCGVRYDG